MKTTHHLLTALVLVISAAIPPAYADESTGTAGKCTSLEALSTQQTVIHSATLIAAGDKVPGARLPGMSGEPGGGAEVAGLPAFCRVVGSLHPEAGSDIGFEVWMPAKDWDGRFHGIGIGGFAGSIDYLTLGGVLRAGQAGAATDTGHKGSSFDSDWAKGHPEKVRDHGWRAVHLTTVTAKQLIADFYGRGPDHSYFVGCSGGGRQGLIEASRYPEDYDGIVAGAPAAVLTDMAMSMINSIQAQQAPGAAIRPEQAKLLESEVLRQCDAGDGQVDELVNDPRHCQFDTSKLACGVSDSPLCFTAPQLGALRQIIAGPHDSSGKTLANGYLPVGSEAGTPVPVLGWEQYQLRGGAGGGAGAELLANGLLQSLIQQPFANAESFDFDTDPARTRAQLAEDLDVVPDLRRFFERGGKLILWHGWADAAIPPGASLDLYQRILHDSGAKAEDALQFFMVPGVQHCYGGKGPGSFGQLGAPPAGATAQDNMVAALQAWVEQGRTPETLVGRYGFAGLMGMPVDKNARSRLLCAEPNTAVLTRGENPDTASSYSCQSPGEH